MRTIDDLILPKPEQELDWIQNFPQQVEEEAAALGAFIATQIAAQIEANPEGKPEGKIVDLPLYPVLRIGASSMALDASGFAEMDLFDDMKWYRYTGYCSAKNLLSLDKRCVAAMREPLARIGYDLQFMARYHADCFSNLERRSNSKVFANSLPIAYIQILPLEERSE